MDAYLRVHSCLGRAIWTSKEDWDHITQTKHPEIAGLEEEVQDTLRGADFVRLSQRDPDVYLYYKRVGKYYLCVVCRHLNGSGFIVTCYLTHRLKKGKEQWPK